MAFKRLIKGTRLLKFKTEESIVTYARQYMKQGAGAEFVFVQSPGSPYIQPQRTWKRMYSLKPWKPGEYTNSSTPFYLKPRNQRKSNQELIEPNNKFSIQCSLVKAKESESRVERMEPRPQCSKILLERSWKRKLGKKDLYFPLIWSQGSQRNYARKHHEKN